MQVKRQDWKDDEELNRRMGEVARSIADDGYVAEVHPTRDGGYKIIAVKRKIRETFSDLI